MKLEKSNTKYKTAANKLEARENFGEGDMVMVYLRRKRISAGAYNKLKPKKCGSFKIVKKISDKAYIMNLPSDMVMSKTFNVSDLYKYHPSKQLYLDYNSRTSSFKEGGTDVEDQGRSKSRQNQTVD